MAACQPASPAESTGWTNDSSKTDGVICPVCIDEIFTPVIGTKLSQQTIDRAFVEIVTLGCGHQMHLTCVIKWFLCSQNVTSNPRDCPLCRSSFSPNLLQVASESRPTPTSASGSHSVHVIHADARFVLHLMGSLSGRYMHDTPVQEDSGRSEEESEEPGA